MNPLETLKEKLRVKPNIDEKQMKQVDVVIPIPSKPEEIKLNRTTIVDERGKEDNNFSIADLSKRLEERKMTKVSIKPSLQLSAPVEHPKQPEKRPVKTGKKKLLILQEEPENLPKITEVTERDLEKEQPPLPEEEPEEEVPIVIQPKRRTKKVPKGIAILEPGAWIDIEDVPMARRLPVKKPHVNYKVSSYYMNNREIFVNFINSLFQPYREELQDDSQAITCDTIGNTSEDFSLLTHQKIVRDYLNLYTPYRGLLLFHGLGSGKTCTSIAIAEGMKSSKQIIVMTPASLRRNYIEELKKCGDAIYKKNQYWEWVSVTKYPEATETLSSVLNLTIEYIKNKKGAWLVNVKKPSNYNEMSPTEKKSLDDQLDEMIQAKYKFINYNGLRREKLKQMSNDFDDNIFDNSVVIIDEAHNFISRIVNKIAKEKEIPMDRRGKKERVSYSLALILYEFLLSAKNARVILLTGTPIINYPNEIGILFNILRGYIKTFEIPLDIKTSQAVNQETLTEMFAREKNLDYLEYSPASKKLVITRNPYGFENKLKKDTGYHGVSNDKKEKANPITGVRELVESGAITDDAFEKRVIGVLKENDIDVIASGIKIDLYKALPDKFDDFVNMFIESGTGNIKNIDLFKNRIIGLTSYFRSAQEKLLPRYDKLTDYHVIKIPMSDYQFGVYEESRQQERKQETSSKRKKGTTDANGVYKDPTSTYRIFSRLFCNFVMPKPPGRPLPREDKEVAAQEGEEKPEETMTALEKLYADALKETNKKGENDLEGDADGEVEGEAVIEKLADSTYEKRISLAMRYLETHASNFLSLDGLETYSPKFLHMLENITDKDHLGLHLVYSQFRTLEGIGLFKMVLEYNGFTQFKIKKNANNVWELDISEENRGKPTFALYTGTESAEEKEIIRNIYNSNWDASSPITSELRKIANNNNMGEIIKVLMITASGSEGINLRSTRYVHIMEPYWHPARMEQVIGRARRICSHKDLPEALQTVEVFVYLMTFSREQIKSDASIELKKKDLSKKKYQLDPSKPEKDLIPLTSDEALFEISNIKEEVSTQLITAVKEASIDCAVYSKRGAKEQLHCLQYGQPKSDDFSFKPSINKEEMDSVAKINKKKIEWTGKEIVLRGKTYIYRKIGKDIGNIYDLDSYQRALEVPGVEPILLGTIEKNAKGEQVFKKI
jgi:hypothetical protein